MFKWKYCVYFYEKNSTYKMRKHRPYVELHIFKSHEFPLKVSNLIIKCCIYVGITFIYILKVTKINNASKENNRIRNFRAKL